jgi:A/G-specific adenine glycosylase
MTQQAFPDDVVSAVRAALLTFFDASARDLPWRGSPDPYAVWISEVMSQQTRIDTVVPYFQRWMERFPDVHSLADAPVDDVLKLWEGLGYYSRARNLHSAARVVRERHGGALPSTSSELRDLPGVGDYTAGAVSSIAFGEAAPAVDGNVRRVLARLLNEADPSPSRLRSAAQQLVPPQRPGDFNQALMELGATVCTPRSPRCGTCPIAPHCAARRLGTQHEVPARRRRQPIPTYDIATVVLRSAERMLLLRRPPTGLLAGMWHFPGAEVPVAADAGSAARRLAGDIAGTDPGSPHALGAVEHTFSHRREIYHAFSFRVAGEQVDAAHPAVVHGTAWVGADENAIALPRAQQRIRALAFR